MNLKRIGAGLLPGLTILLLAFLFGWEGNREEVAQRGTSALRWMWSRWSGLGGGLAHVWVVPLISLYLVWRKRAALRVAPKAVQWSGWWLCLGCLLLYGVGLRVQQTRLTLLALVGLIWAIPFFGYGWKTARHLVFPCAYLLFCVPLSFLDSITLPLRHGATIAAGVILNGVGVPVLRQGTALLGAGDLVLDVADPCSGLRYLLTLTAIAAPYAYLTQRRNRSRWIVFLSAFPLAVVGNVVRIVAIALVARFWGLEPAMGLYHNFSGYVVFIVAIGLMLLLGEGLERWDRKAGKPDTTADCPPAEWPPSAGWGLPRRAGVALVLLLGAAGLGVMLYRQWPVPEPRAGIRAELPARIGSVVGEEMMFCQREACRRAWARTDLPADAAESCPACGGPLADWALAEKNILPADTEIVHRRYRLPGGAPLQVTLVLNGREQKSIHRPEQCLPAQGFTLNQSRERRIPRPGRPELTVRRMVLRPTGGPAGGDLVFAYWFIGPDRETASHIRRLAWMAWESLRDGVPARWAYVAVASEWPREPAPRDDERLESFLRELSLALSAQ